MPNVTDFFGLEGSANFLMIIANVAVERDPNAEPCLAVASSFSLQGTKCLISLCVGPETLTPTMQRSAIPYNIAAKRNTLPGIAVVVHHRRYLVNHSINQGRAVQVKVVVVGSEE
jgi:hypothetical protein